MCLITTQTEPLIATRNIRVYKYGYKGKLSENEFKTSHQRYQYEIWVLVEETFTYLKDDYMWQASCARMENKLEKKFGDFLGPSTPDKIENRKANGLKCVKTGFHAVTTLKEAQARATLYHIGEFIIPKGASYYKFAGETVSNQIIFKGFI